VVDLIHKEESYIIVGCCYDVFNALGPGLREKNYQKALEERFKESSIKYESQVYVPIKINEKVVGKYYIDLFVYGKIPIEIKVGRHFYKKDIDQLYSYLRSTNLQLGLLINFTTDGVQSKRILNIE
jgi:GxxExxY protein